MVLTGLDPRRRILERSVSVDRPYVTENDAERERLRSLVTGLSDEELSRPMPGGWTIAGVLAHIGFWDARAIFFLDKWGRGIAPSRADYVSEDVDAVNESAKPLCLALPPRDAAQLALRLAEEADGKVKALSEELLAKIRSAGMLAPSDLHDENGSPFNLARATHRREHLDEIERASRA
jgi:DinB family protein